MADLKLIAKTIKGQQTLASQLFETGIMDAMYLAGMVANGAPMSKSQLNSWAEAAAVMPMVSEYTVPWVAVESEYGRDLAVKWIKSKKEHVAASGWCTYSGLIATKPDDELDLKEIESLLDRVVKEIKRAEGRERYTMNGFVIAVGAYVAPLVEQAKSAARRMGVVSVDMGDTACEVRGALSQIEKIESMGRTGRKRKTIRC
jgi:hypothetical protein